MIQNELHVIAELYRLLATVDTSVLKRAIQREGLSANVRGALQCLLTEAQQGEAARSKATGPRAPATGEFVGVRPRVGTVHPKVLESLLSDRKRFRTRQDVIRFAEELGFRVPFRPKDNRDRVIKRFVSYVISDPKRMRDFSEGLLRTGDRQTRGWIDLILRAPE